MQRFSRSVRRRQDRFEQLADVARLAVDLVEQCFGVGAVAELMAIDRRCDVPGLRRGRLWQRAIACSMVSVSMAMIPVCRWRRGQ